MGSRIHAGTVDGLKKIKNLISVHPDKKFIVFATGATPAAAVDVVQDLWKRNLSDSELNAIPHFYFQSGLRYEKMGFLDRNIMKMVASAMSKKKDKTDNESGFADAIQQSHDHSSSAFIYPLIHHVENMIL